MKDSIGRRIKKLRTAEGKTQAALAECIDSSRSSVAAWENDNRDPTSSDIVSLSKHFSVSADYILGISETPSTDIDIQNVSEYTGLSTRTIQALHNSNIDNGIFHELVTKILFNVCNPPEVPEYVAYLLLSVAAKHRISNLSADEIHNEHDNALASRITSMTEYFKGLSVNPTYNQLSQLTKLFHFNAIEESELYPSIIKKRIHEMVDLAVDMQINEMTRGLTKISKRGRPGKNAESSK